MYKNLFLIFAILVSGCSLNNPISLYTRSINILPPNSHHTPEIEGVLIVKTEGYVKQIFFDNPTTRPTTMPNKLSPINPMDMYSPIKDDFGNILTPRFFNHKIVGAGSCFVVAKQNGYYYVATAKHIIAPNPTQVLIDGQIGEHVESLKAIDVSILRFKSKKNYPIYELGNAEFMEDAWLIGFPGSLDTKRRKFTVKGSICNISKGEIWFSGGGTYGMSGGVLLNRRNEALGVVSRFLATARHCDNFICSTPSSLFKFTLKTILLKDEIKNLTKKINILEGLRK